MVYPETSSDSASAKSKGALLTSNKKEIIISPKTLENKKTNQIYSWITTNTEKLKDSEIKTTFKINSPKNNSKLETNKQALTAAKTEYLFLLKYPVKITQKLNNKDNKEAYTRLYSISKILNPGAQTVLTQKV